MNNPKTAKFIAKWYKTLHQKGREYLCTHDFIDEYDKLTVENLKFVQEKTGTDDAEVWQVIENNFEKIRSAVMGLPRTLVYTDFHFTNLAVARDGTSALVFDYNFFYKSYAYSDIRNVCYSLSDEAKEAFLNAYGEFDKHEVVVDDAVSILSSLFIVCSHNEIFPDWAIGLIDMLKGEWLMAAIKKLLEANAV